MTSGVRYPGKWWRPEREEKRVGGVLEISPDGTAELEVFDGLLEDDSLDILHGQAAGKDITLVNTFRRTGSTVMGQAYTVTETISASIVFVGAHLRTELDEIFSEATVEIECLTSWVNASGISFSMFFKDEDFKQVKSQKLEAALPDSVTISRPEWEQLIELQWSMRIQNEALFTWGKDAYFKETVILSVKNPEPASWNSFNDKISSVQNLLTLATRRGCAVRNRKLIVVEDGQRWPVEVHFSRSSEWVDEKIEPRKFLFNLDGIGDDPAAAFDKWFTLEKQIGLAMDVLFSLYHSPPTYLENELFNIASAAEGFHAGLFPNTKQLDEDLHADIVSLAKSSFRDHPGRNFVLQAVNANRPGLKQRLLELASVPDAEAVKGLLGDVDTWAKWLVKARNAVGHMKSGELEKKVPENARYRLPYVSRALLNLVLMQELGISAELQRRAVDDLYSYSARQFKKAVTAAIAPSQD